MSSTAVDINSAIEQAKKEVRDEEAKKAVAALKMKYKSLASAESVVANIKREIADLEQSVRDGSFVG